jgi:hypothetical protein
MQIQKNHGDRRHTSLRHDIVNETIPHTLIVDQAQAASIPTIRIPGRGASVRLSGKVSVAG